MVNAYVSRVKQFENVYTRKRKRNVGTVSSLKTSTSFDENCGSDNKFLETDSDGKDVRVPQHLIRIPPPSRVRRRPHSVALPPPSRVRRRPHSVAIPPRNPRLNQEMKHLTPEALPPPPPVVPSGLVPTKAYVSNRVPMTRQGFGTKGQTIALVTNHFSAKLSSTSDYFYQYRVVLFDEDGNPVEAKGVGKRVLDMVNSVGGRSFAYDGEKTLFTVGSLADAEFGPHVLMENIYSDREGPMKPRFEFAVCIENQSSNRTVRGGGSPKENDPKTSRRPPQSNTYRLQLNYETRIPIQDIFYALRGQESEHCNEARRILDVLLRQHAAKQGCILVRQCVFHNDSKNSISTHGSSGGVAPQDNNSNGN